jgi:hypothetical protein
MNRRNLVLLTAGLAALVPLAAYARSHADSPRLSSSPMAGLLRSEADLAPVVGVVEERVPAGSYTYLAVRRADGSLAWAVTVGRGAAVGERVTIRSFGRQRSFVSPRLHRTFAELVFGLVSPSP